MLEFFYGWPFCYFYNISSSMKRKKFFWVGLPSLGNRNIRGCDLWRLFNKVRESLPILYYFSLGGFEALGIMLYFGFLKCLLCCCFLNYIYVFKEEENRKWFY